MTYYIERLTYIANINREYCQHYFCKIAYHSLTTAFQVWLQEKLEQTNITLE